LTTPISKPQVFFVWRVLKLNMRQLHNVLLSNQLVTSMKGPLVPSYSFNLWIAYSEKCVHQFPKIHFKLRNSLLITKSVVDVMDGPTHTLKLRTSLLTTLRVYGTVWVPNIHTQIKNLISITLRTVVNIAITTPAMGSFPCVSLILQRVPFLWDLVILDGQQIAQ
jgi:hypothetical protein